MLGGGLSIILERLFYIYFIVYQMFYNYDTIMYFSIFLQYI